MRPFRWSGWLDLLFPLRCAGCDRVGEAPFCQACAATLRTPPSGCAVCGGPAEGGSEPTPGARPRCRECTRAPPAFASARAPFLYEGALADAVHALKYRGRAELAGPLGLLFAGVEPPRADVICPLPLHPERLRERGSDQALLLAQAASRQLGLPVRSLLLRARPTASQVGLDRAGRELNLRGAFRASPGARGLRVCILDDVFTTGATANAAARALRAAGARRVEVRALCQAR
jgi:ComF family protein